MNWVYWNTFWTLAGSLVWFMTIVSHPDAVVVDRVARTRLLELIGPEAAAVPDL